MNKTRIFWGGLAAGLLMNLLDFFTNVPWLGPQWEAAMRERNLDPAQFQVSIPAGWITVDFLCGWVLVWLYAAMRPRFGPGPGTAVLASWVVWLLVHAVIASYVFSGYAPLELVAKAACAEMISALAGGLLGGWIYREK